MVVLDTCAMIEWLKPLPSFSTQAIRLMNHSSSILAVSFAEIACKVKIGKLDLSTSPRELFQYFNQINNIEIIDIGVKEWLDAIEMLWNENKDPADRIITSYAIQNELVIVTTDEKIKKFYKKTMW